MVHKLLVLLAFCVSCLVASVPSSQTKFSTAMERIVYMERTPGSPQMLDSKHVHTLASVLGSEEAARKAIIYSFKNTIDGFYAILTEPQVKELAKQPGVLKIIPAPIYQLPQDQVDESSP